MKYKVGDKVKIKENLIVGETYGGIYLYGSACRHIGEETLITKVIRDRYRLGVDNSSRIWAGEMLEPVEEMSAEELAKTIGNICKVHNECKECPFHDVGDEDYCVIRMGKNSDKTLKIAKQWKADHEKKPIETEFIYIVRIIEDKQCVHEEEIVGESEDEACERVLKKYCEDHEGKFYAVVERICRVKE